MRILVTGANGQLGNELRVLAKNAPEHDFIFSDITEHPTDKTEFIDITKKVELDGQLDFIVNCAAYTNVDAAEDNEGIAFKLNCIAPSILAGLALEKGAALIHISTDYVFNGNGTRPYTDTDSPDPVSAYGRTKLAGEKTVISSGCRYVIIRTAWLYSEYGRNFLKTMMRLTSEKPEVKVVNDQIGSPTYALDLAKAIMTVVKAGVNAENQGIYHFSNEGVCSWYDFASEIARLGGHDGVVKPCTSAEFPSKVHRPAYSVLDKSKIKEVFGAEVPQWQDSLKECYGKMAGE